MDIACKTFIQCTKQWMDIACQTFIHCDKRWMDIEWKNIHSLLYALNETLKINIFMNKILNVHSFRQRVMFIFWVENPAISKID